MKKLWRGEIIAVAVIVLIGGGIYLYNYATDPVALATRNTEAQLRLHMKDPDSMKIRASYVLERQMPDGELHIYVCGIVDGKNSFGAYNGGTRFVSVSRSNSKSRAFGTSEVQIEDLTAQASYDKVGMLSGFDLVYWNPDCSNKDHPAVVAKVGDINR